MHITYKKLWHLLIEREMTKSNLLEVANLNWGTMSKLSKGENVNTAILLRICIALGCNIGDIMDIVPDDGQKETSSRKGRRIQATG